MKQKNSMWKGKECAFVLLQINKAVKINLRNAIYRMALKLLATCVLFFCRFTNDGLKRLCEIFDLEKKGNRVML